MAHGESAGGQPPLTRGRGELRAAQGTTPADGGRRLGVGRSGEQAPRPLGFALRWAACGGKPRVGPGPLLLVNL